MTEKEYQVIIAILSAFLAVVLYLLITQPVITMIDNPTITYEQTPFQRHCPVEPKVNCSTVMPVATVTEKIKNYTASEDGDNPEPAPTGNPVPTIIPVPTTTMPVPEFPFLNSH